MYRLIKGHTSIAKHVVLKASFQLASSADIIIVFNGTKNTRRSCSVLFNGTTQLFASNDPNDEQTPGHVSRRRNNARMAYLPCTRVGILRSANLLGLQILVL